MENTPPQGTPGGFPFHPQQDSAQGKGSRNNMLLVVLAGVAGACVGGLVVYYLTVVVRSGWQPFAPLVVGPVVGLAMRFASRHSQPGIGWLAVILTLIAAGAGFIMADMALPWKPPSTFDMAFNKLFIPQVIILMGLTAYIAYGIANSKGIGGPGQGPGAQGQG